MTVDEGLVIVPAGAGAGKTHRIKAQLSDWVRGGVVRPERILAVTFTEAAAGELRERIRAALLAEGLVSEAMAVERAYVSTIHGLGLRILTEHALAAGASPQPRHLGDPERDLLIRQALAHAKALDPIKAEPERFGYTENYGTGESVEDALRGRVLAMIDLLRGLGDTGHDPKLIKPALSRLEDVYGKTIPNPDTARDQLLSAVQAMLKAFPNGGMEMVTAKRPREDLEANLELFKQLSKDPKILDWDWQAWQRLRDLFTSNRSSKTPDGYDDRASAIMTAADVLPSHPGPLADAKLHLLCLISCAQEVMEAYENRKKGLGLIDFADMISGAERLLRTNPSVRDAVLGEIDCVIIDEFQDTNPVQFALLWQLGSRAPRTLLVGDVKQSIMGFQGADPRLSQALAAANPSAIQPLDRNWRSTPDVMNFVNAVGSGLFGSDYNALTPTRDPITGPALEVLNVKKGRRVRNFSKPQEHIAEHIVHLLNEGAQISDKPTKTMRAARPSDIALLVCKHSTASRYAEELRARGVPVRIAEDGWLESLVVQVARAALSYAANPEDIHAALLLRTLGPDPLPLQEALSAQLEGQLFDDPVLKRLAALSDHILDLPSSASLGLVLEAAGLHPWAMQQTDAAQARADLLRLEAEAEEFEKVHRDLKAASGFHGETAKVFLGWLASRSSERDFDRRPNPAANSADAVEIVTWHSSKGREWPITVVAEFDHGIEERPGNTSTRFESLDLIEDMSAVLASAVLVHTPSFAAPEAQKRFIEDRRPSFEANAKNLLYVALTRARDRLVLEWPTFLNERSEDAPEATRLFHVFEDACQPKLKAKSVKIGDVKCAAQVINLPERAEQTQYANANQAEACLFGSEPRLPEVQLSPWRLNPSQAGVSASPPKSRAITLGDKWPAAINDAARGTALHLAMRTYLTRPDLASNLPAATGLDEESLKQVSERAIALQTWLTAQGYPELRCEIPILGHTKDGAEIPGVVDLLAIGPDGALLIDHKTGGAGEGLGPHWPQLSAYAELVSDHLPTQGIKGVGVHWMDHGTIELVDWDPPRP